MAPWYTITDIDQLDTPSLVVYPERVKHNIELLKSTVDSTERLRVHAKTHKSAQATRLLLEAGIRKFKCATIAEAEMLARCGAPDVLLAYQPAGPKIQRFIHLVQGYPATQFACLADNLQTAEQLSQAATQAELTIALYADLNVGMNRTGISPGAEALKLYTLMAELPGLQLMGLHAYDGHIHERDYPTRQQQCLAAFEPVKQLVSDIIKRGLAQPAVIAGGSPTFPIHAALLKDYECSPGTFIYWDWGYSQQLPEQQFLPAALVITRVVSIPAPNLVCLDAGHKAIGSESALDKRIHFLNAPGLKITGHSEEHLIAESTAQQQFKIGDVLYGVPYHVCPTVALYEHATTIVQGRISGEWKTSARNRKINL